MLRLDRVKPRVVLLTYDGAYSRLFIQALLADAAIDVVGVVYSRAFLQRGLNWLVDLARFIGRVGPFYALYQAYVAWWLPQMISLKRWAVGPVLETNDVNADACVAWLKAREPDFLLSCHFNQKMLESVIKVPRRAALNFHPSYLPAWRGVDPVLFALQEKGSVLGGSIHKVTAEIDEGDVLLREKLSNEHVAGLVKTNEALFTLGGRMAAEVIGDFDAFDGRRLRQAELVAGVDCKGRYDGWYNVGQLGLAGLWKALWAKPRKVL